MRELSDRDILYGVSITVTRENIEQVTSDSYLDGLRQTGCKVVFYVEYVPAAPETKALAPGDREREFLENTLVKLRKRSDDMIYISFPGDEELSGGCLAAGRDGRSRALSIFSLFGYEPEGCDASAGPLLAPVQRTARGRYTDAGAHGRLRFI